MYWPRPHVIIARNVQCLDVSKDSSRAEASQVMQVEECMPNVRLYRVGTDTRAWLAALVWRCVSS